MKEKIGGFVVVALLFVGYNAYRYWSWSNEPGMGEVDSSGTSGSITIDGRTFELSGLVLTVEESDWGENPFTYSFDAMTAGDGECSPYLDTGVWFYGTAGDFESHYEIEGETFPIEFSGDGDDNNVCLPGLAGFLAAEPGARLTIDSIDGTRAEVHYQGTFQVYGYDEGEDLGKVEASGEATVAFEFLRCATEECEDYAPWPPG